MKYILFIVFFLLYYFTSFTKVPFGDCIGFVTAFEKGEWVTTITAISHFLYYNFGILLKKIFPFVTSIEIGRFISVFTAALCISLMYNLLKEIGGSKKWSIWITVAFGLSFTFWRNATNLEMYTFNAVFIMLFYIYLIKSVKTGLVKYYWITGILLGISFGSHIQNIMLLPCLGVFALLKFKENKWAAFIPLLSSFSFFVLIYIVNHIQTVGSNQVLRTDSVWVKDTLSKSIAQYFKDILKSIGYLIYNFWFLTPFIILGIIRMWKEEQKLLIVLLASVLFNLGFATFYAVSDNYVYFIISYVILFVFVYYGIIKTESKFSSMRLLKPLILLTPLYYFLSYNLVFQTDAGKSFHHQKEYKGGLNYYLLPWMNNNVGILEFVIEGKLAPDKMDWMTESAKGYIELVKHQYLIEDIKKQ